MGQLHAIGKIIIRVYANDHLPQHFHVKHPDFEALVEIETLAFYAGAIPARYQRQVWAWIRANRAVIRAEWNRINPRYPC